MPAYYNENDKFAAAWLRELIKAGLIADGEVDERSIEDVVPSDLAGFTQCHFFAGIGGWSYALRLAGWPDNRPVWTGSCPCQSFSTAGKGKGFADTRHLWPSWFRLIRECKPVTIFGEQVDAAIRHGWLDLVSTELESCDYAVGAAVMGAHSVGAPHIRKRLYFVADSAGIRCEQQWDSASTSIQRPCTKRSGQYEGPEQSRELSRRLEGLCSSSELDNATDQGLSLRTSQEILGEKTRGESQRSSDVGSVELPECNGLQRRLHGGPNEERETLNGTAPGCDSATSGLWSGADWLFCRDEKYRAVESGAFPLAHGVRNRVGKLRGYGNAIVAPCAEAFVRAYLELYR